MKRMLVIVGACVIGACGGGSSSPSAPSILSVAGTWTGTATSNVLQPGAVGPVRVTFTQTGADLTGSWSAGNDSGQLTGTVTGSAVQMVLRSSVPTNCPSTANVTVSGTQMTGTYALFNCTVADSGSVSLTKQ